LPLVILNVVKDLGHPLVGTVGQYPGRNYAKSSLALMRYNGYPMA